MSIRLIICLALLNFPSLLHSQRVSSQRLETEAQSISLTPVDGDLFEGLVFVVTFPQAMVPADLVDVAGQTAPFAFTPGLSGEFFWKSVREARFQVRGAVRPGQEYRISLTDGLNDAAGQAVTRPNWSQVRYQAKPLQITSRFRDRDTFLSNTPEVDVRTNYAVRPEDVMRTTSFQNRDTRDRFPVTVVLPEVKTRTATEDIPVPANMSRFYVTPENPLPVDGTYDLVFEGLTDADTQTPMAGIKVFSLGTTSTARITQIRASAPPLEKPFISLTTSTPIDTASVSLASVQIAPAVTNFQVHANRGAIRLHGDFDLAATYQIHLTDQVRTVSGYPLTGLGPFEATFDGLEPMIAFPEAQFYQRCQLGLNVTALQSNCTSAEWTLAAVPMVKYAAVQQRLKEFEDTERDLFTGQPGQPIKTELLVNAFSLPRVASGKLPDANKHEAVYRNLRWQPDNDSILPGVYLLEMTASHPNKAMIGNRSLVIFNEVVVSRKLTNEQVIVRVADMTSAIPVANAAIEIIDAHNVALAHGTTDVHGMATFQRRDVSVAGLVPAFVIVRSERGGGMQPFQGVRFYNSAWIESWDVDEASAVPDSSRLLTSVFSDRSLYQPGETVHVKGSVRWQDTAQDNVLLEIPAIGSSIKWTVTEGYYGTTITEGASATDGFGGWQAEWPVSKTQKLGDYFIHYQMDGSTDRNAHRVQIQEYRTPLFDVVLSTQDPHSANANVGIQSNYFHGSANVGALARWTAHWSPNFQWQDDFQETDSHSADYRDSTASLTRSGEVRLDADGSATLNLENPFPKPLQHGRYRVNVTVDVISPEGQTISRGLETVVQPTPIRASIKLTRTEDDAVEVHVRATDRTAKHIDGEVLALKVYFVESRTVKERLGPRVFRYRNFPQFELIHDVDVGGDQSYRFTPTKTGYYVAVASLKNHPDAASVSDRSHIVSGQAGHYDILNDAEITIQPDQERYIAGQETAKLTLQTPFGGQAWVCLETDRIIDQFVTQVDPGNPTINVPILANYHPNIHVSVYLLRQGADNRLPMERFGHVDLEVDRPELKLNVTPALDASNVQPGEDVSGVVQVMSAGSPVANADVTVFAVDAAIHLLGDWQMPNWFDAYYQSRYHGVASYRGLDGHYESFEPADVTEKGFLIGGAGDDEAFMAASVSPQVRKNFKALAYWKTQLRTDAQGQVPFTFPAPDNLTRYRVIAVAQTADHRFGEGLDSFEVAKRLMVEPALPQFVRRGDEIEWRAVVRQDYLDEVSVTLSCKAEGNVEWLTDSQQTVFSLSRGLPQVVRFPCRVVGGDEVRVTFEAYAPEGTGLRDAAELTLPVHLPGILQRTGRFGIIPKSEATFQLQSEIPDLWKDTDGHYQMTVSYSPFLPELNSLPEVLEYPHGCLEQKSSRYLTYSLLADLLDYVPDLKQRHANYQSRLEMGLREYEEALLDNGFIPYWDGGYQPNAWVTVMAYWLKESLLRQNRTVSERLDEQLSKAIQIIIGGKAGEHQSNPTIQAFALFVRAESDHSADDTVPVYQELYARRADLTSDGLALLGLAMNRSGIMNDQQAQLLRLLTSKGKDADAFDPVTFSSASRNHSLTQLLSARRANPRQRQEIVQAFLKQSDEHAGGQLSTQEHYWNMLLLKELMTLPKGSGFTDKLPSDRPDIISTNRASIAWATSPLRKLQTMALDLGRAEQDRFFLINAEVLRQPKTNETPEDRGFRLERVVTNLTDANRSGSEQTPYAIGDELLITYRFNATRNNYYVALTDELPAAIETVNFNLPQVAQLYALPSEVQSTLHLDHSELRKQAANLYFDRVQAGNHSYSILARVTSVGQCTWPAAQITPMYQPYYGGLTPAQTVFSRGS